MPRNRSFENRTRGLPQGINRETEATVTKVFEFLAKELPRVNDVEPREGRRRSEARHQAASVQLPICSFCARPKLRVQIPRSLDLG